MEDYEHRHADAWLDDEALERKRRNRVNNASANKKTDSGPNDSSSDQNTQSSATHKSSNSPFHGSRPFDIRNRDHSAYPDQVVATQPTGGLIQSARVAFPRRDYANRTRGRDGPLRRPRPNDRKEQDLRGQGFDWLKVRAYDARREVRQVNKSQQEEAIQQLRERPENLDAYDFQSFYWWPSDDIPMEEFNNHYDKSFIEELRYGTRSWVEFDTSESLVRVWSMEELAVRSVALRINNLVKELIAKINNSMRIRFVQHPIRGIEGANIGIQPAPDARPGFPVLTYSSEPEPDTKDPKAPIVRLEIAKMMARIVGQCIKNLRSPQQYVKMRLQIGLLTLGRRFNFKPGRDHYDFNEFVDMLEQNLTESDLDSLTPNGVAEPQLEKIKQLNILRYHGMSYSGTFQFDDATTDSTLAIQHEWNASKYGEDLELVDRHWLSLPKVPEQKALEITVVDFDKADTQLKIDASNMYGHKNIVRRQLAKFEDSIRFTPNANALTVEEPQPCTHFLWSIGNLQVVKEKTIMHFDIDSTTYRFSIIRTDTYKIDALKRTRQLQSSDFEFVIFDPDWDSNLSEFATLAPGQEVTWKRSIMTFFNKPFDTTSDDINEGFYRFLEVVEKVVGMVQRALAGDVESSEGSEKGGSGRGVDDVDDEYPLGSGSGLDMYEA